MIPDINKTDSDFTFKRRQIGAIIMSGLETNFLRVTPSPRQRALPQEVSHMLSVLLARQRVDPPTSLLSAVAPVKLTTVALCWLNREMRAHRPLLYPVKQPQQGGKKLYS